MKNRLLVGFLLCQFVAIAQVKAPFQVFVSPFGKDLNANGSAQKPLASIDFALKRASSSAHKNIEIHVAKGVYYLDKTIVLSSSDFTDKQLTIIGNGAVISAGQQLNLKWTPYDDKIWQASLDTDAFDQLFINRTPQILARYPNYDASARNFNGTVADALDKVKTWKNPAGVFVHGLHEGEWGSFHYQITAIKNDKIMWEGGWQNNRPAPLHKKYCFVENAFEALDSPNEWYFDKESKMLYYYPDKNLDLNKAKIVISRLKHSIEIVGTEQNPIKNISIRGLRFMHNERTFMQAYEPLLRSDWRIYRGGAIVLENTENCTIIGCEFSDMGGNSVFFSRYNQHSSVKSSHFHDIGASAICFVGDTSAVRSATFQYDFFIPYENLDKVAGPKNEKYPRNCTASDNLIYRIGKVEKQSTGVHIEMASEIEVSHNTIYEVPRAGINIGSGCWGGHKIANNDVFDTVLETGDHGAFNSWGRDRFWHPDRKKMDEMASAHPELILLDMVKPTQIYGNRFRCDHGWDIDLDDGSSNYQIYNNVCLNGGLKLREGFYRKVENNVLINNSFHPHVWFKNSGDAFRHNIIQKKYFPILVNDWGNKIDQNLFPDDESLSLARKNETDKNSQVGNPQFVAANKGNYQVAANSPALQIGFKNFPMNDFGVKSQKLKYLARKPVIPDLSINQILANKSSIIPFLGGEIKSIEGLGERSAYGLPDETGVLVVSVNQFLTKSGLQKQDVIRMADGIPIKDAKTLLDIVQSSNWKPSIIIEVLRNQQLQKIVLSLK